MNDKEWNRLATMKINVLVACSVIQGIAIIILAIAVIRK